VKFVRILLGLLILPVAYTAGGQLPVEERVQQLKDAWYKQAQELTELGAKIIEKNDLIASMQDNIKSILALLAGNNSAELDQETCEIFKNETDKFFTKFFHAFRDDINLKGFLVQELMHKKGDFFKGKKAYSGALDRIKFNLIQIIVEANLIVKLLENYEECLQKLAEIESELVSLGQPRLYD
jgi:hypothetical protein